MSKDIMLVSSVPTFMMNDLQQEYVLHDHAHILDPEAFTKVTAVTLVNASGSRMCAWSCNTYSCCKSFIMNVGTDDTNIMSLDIA